MTIWYNKKWAQDATSTQKAMGLRPFKITFKFLYPCDFTRFFHDFDVQIIESFTNLVNKVLYRKQIQLHNIFELIVRHTNQRSRQENWNYLCKKKELPLYCYTQYVFLRNVACWIDFMTYVNYWINQNELKLFFKIEKIPLNTTNHRQILSSETEKQDLFNTI